MIKGATLIYHIHHFMKMEKQILESWYRTIEEYGIPRDMIESKNHPEISRDIAKELYESIISEHKLLNAST